MKKFLLLSNFAFCILHAIAQNVGIGTATPNSSAMLEVQSANKGMLVPRIVLTAANSASPVTSPADALLVYNTATAGTGINAIVPGFYYWNASAARWNALKESSNSNNAGFGSWGDCSMNNISDYHPVVDETGTASELFGAHVSISGDYAIVGAEQDDAGAKGSASIYKYNGTKWALMQKITDATGETNDFFGSSVFISGNYAIVGAYQDDIGANANQGSASIYKFNGSTWVLMSKITDPNGAVNDFFGYSVSISGNYAIVGAYQDDVRANVNQGSAFIYKYDGVNWVLMQKISDATGAANDFFGCVVAISGNYAIVGAFGDDFEANTDQGSVAIYQFNGTSWIVMQKITDASGSADDHYGYSVSISGNYAIVGALGDDVGTNNSQGSVSIYQYNGTSWVLMQKISDATGETNDNFGYSVSISENYAIVGANGDAVGGNKLKGSASIYQRLGSGWQKLQYLTDPGGNANDLFGSSTAIDGASKRFVNGARGYARTSGKVVFGKVN